MECRSGPGSRKGMTEQLREMFQERIHSPGKEGSIRKKFKITLSLILTFKIPATIKNIPEIPAVPFPWSCQPGKDSVG